MLDIILILLTAFAFYLVFVFYSFAQIHLDELQELKRKNFELRVKTRILQNQQA